MRVRRAVIKTMQCEYLARVSQLVDGELGQAEAARFREHLAECAVCQSAEADFRALRRHIKPSAAVIDERVQQRALTAILATGKAREDGQKFSYYARLLVSPRYAVAGIVLCFALSVGFFLYLKRPASLSGTSPAIVNSNAPSWEVERLAGAPRVGGSDVNKAARLSIGEWLVTDEASRARVDVADIGHVEVEANSRLRLVESNESEHRLALARGKISALIYAPPRLFFVDTPSAVAVDYGCAYTLEVDGQGKSILHVTAGWVALEAEGGESFVPAGAACATEPGRQPGTPYPEDVSARFKDALAEVDFSTDPQARAAALVTVLKEAGRKRDALTLWHLLARVEGEDRARTFTRLNQLVSLPAGVTREGVLRLEREMLERWKDAVEAAWYEDAA